MALSLAEVQAAIADVVKHGQSYTLPSGRQVNHPPLAELRKMEESLLAETGQASDQRRYGHFPMAFTRNAQGGSTVG